MNNSENAAETAVASFNGAELPWEVAGPTDAPAVLLLHAGVATAAMWQPQFHDLARDHRVIRFDMRWFGRSKSSDVEYSNRADAVAVLDAAGVERATLIGASYGGGVALDIAVEFPERVSGIVTIGSGPSGFPQQALTEHEDALLAPIDEAEESGDWARLVELEADFWGIGPTRERGDVDPAFLAQLRELGRANIPQLDSVPRTLPLEPRAYGRLSDVAVPALVLVGEHDFSLAQAQAKFLAEALPHARYEVLPDAAHLPSIEQPEAFLAVLRAWLATNGL